MVSGSLDLRKPVSIAVVFIKNENEKIRNGIWAIHLHNHFISDALYKI